MEVWLNTIGSFFYSSNAHQCSPASYALLYSILVVALIISAGGVYVWRRLFVHQRPAPSGQIPFVEFPPFCR